MDILELYRQMLQSLDCIISPEGLVSTTINGSPEPLIVTKADNKRLTLPTPFYLDNPQEDVLVQFHPMSEGIDKGESEVLTALKRLITSNLMFRICDVMALVAKIAADPSSQQHLKPGTLREFSKYLQDFDKKTHKLVMDLLGKINPGDRDHNGRSCTTINVTLARRANILDKPYQRVAVVSFPILEAIIAAKEEMLEKGNGKIFGVTPGKKGQYDMLINLFNFIFPESEIIGMWSAGSNSLAAPYFHALGLTYIKIAERLNQVVKMLSKNAEKEHPNLLYNLTWKNDFDDLTPYVGRLPPAQHNKGKMAGKNEEDDNVKNAITRMAPEAPQYLSQPAAQPVVPQPAPMVPTMAPAPVIAHSPQPIQMEPSMSSTEDPLATLNKLNAPRHQAMQQAMDPYGRIVNVPVHQPAQVLVQPQAYVGHQPVPQPMAPMMAPAPMVQDPIVQAVAPVRDAYGNFTGQQQYIQLPLSQFNQLVQTGQLAPQQPTPVQGSNVMAAAEPYSYRDGALPTPPPMMQGQPMYGQPPGGYIRQGGRMSAGEREAMPRMMQPRPMNNGVFY